jgi:DNA-directed RNA polymerase subunit D
MTEQRRKVERGEGEYNLMSLKILKAEDRFIKFSIDGITPTIANALRRTLLDDIPKLAIDKVIFHHGQIRDREGNVYDSSLPLFDEIVAHRLSLVPLVSDPKMNFREECACEGKGCPLCTMSYSINKIGPAVVTSGDLQPMGNPDLTPADPDIPIVKLGPKQAILVTGEAIMGRGKTHTKWQATSGVFYKYHREFVVTKSELENWTSVKEKCPLSVISEDSKTIRFTDDDGCKAVRQLLDYPSVKVIEDDTQFIFQFETDGSYKAIDVLEYALKRLPQRLNTLLESLTTPD